MSMRVKIVYPDGRNDDVSECGIISLAELNFLEYMEVPVLSHRDIFIYAYSGRCYKYDVCVAVSLPMSVDRKQPYLFCAYRERDYEYMIDDIERIIDKKSVSVHRKLYNRWGILNEYKNSLYVPTDASIKHYVYLLYHKNDIIYVGQTGDIKTRIRNHRAEGKKEIDWIRVAELKNHADAMLYERYYINRFRPYYNVADVFDSRLDVGLPELDFKIFVEKK